MHRHLLSGAAEEIVLPGRGGDIAEPGQLPRIKAVSRQRTHHGAACDGLRQIHEAAALGDTGHPRVYNVSDLPAQGVVFLQLRRVKLRVAAAQVQALYTVGELFVRQRAEGYQLRPQLPQQVEAVLIVKAERPVAGHADPHRRALFRQYRRREVQHWRIVGDLQQRVQLQRLFRRLRQLPQLLPQIRHLVRCHQPQMAALQRALRQTGQVAAGTDAQTIFQLPRQRAVAHGAAPVEDDAPDAAVRREAEKALRRRQNRQRRAPGVDHQHHGAFRFPRRLIGAGAGGCQPQTVIIAHDSLNHRDIAVLTVVSQQIAHGVAVKKEAVQIGAFRADDPAMEHGVDVIRAAFRRPYPQPPPHQRLQHGAGNGGLAAAAVGSGKHQPGHSSLHSVLSIRHNGGKIADLLRQLPQVGIDLLRLQPAVRHHPGICQQAVAL